MEANTMMRNTVKFAANIEIPRLNKWMALEIEILNKLDFMDKDGLEKAKKVLMNYLKTHDESESWETEAYIEKLASLSEDDIWHIRNATSDVHPRILYICESCRDYLARKPVATVNVTKDGRIEGYLTVNEFAELNNVSSGLVRVWIHEGKIKPDFKIGPMNFIREGTPRPNGKIGRPKRKEGDLANG